MEYFQYLPVLMAVAGLGLRAYLSLKEWRTLAKVTEVRKEDGATTAASRKNDAGNAVKKTVAYGSGLAHV